MAKTILWTSGQKKQLKTQQSGSLRVACSAGYTKVAEGFPSIQVVLRCNLGGLELRGESGHAFVLSGDLVLGSPART